MPPRSPAVLADKPDAELAARVRAGENAAFEALVQRHRRDLHRCCRRLLDEAAAEDAVQQTFLSALQALRAGTEVRRLRPWLHRIARNVALNELARSRAGEQELTDEHVDRRDVDVVEDRALLRAALEAVAALPGRQRSALLGATRGESHTELAARLGVNEASARQILCRARAAVRAAVGGWVPAPLAWLARRAGAFAARLPGPPPAVEPLIPKFAVAVAVGVIAAPAGLVAGHSRPSGHPVRAARANLDPTAGADHKVMKATRSIVRAASAVHILTVPWHQLGARPGDGGRDRRRPAEVAGTRAAPGLAAARGAAGQGAAAGTVAQAPEAVDSTAIATGPAPVDQFSADPAPSDPAPSDPAASDPAASDPAAGMPTTTDQTATVTDSTVTTDPSAGTTVTDPMATDPTASPQTTTDTAVTDPTVSSP